LNGNVTLHSRLFIGTGKFGNDSVITKVIERSGAQVITVAVRRVDFNSPFANVMKHIPEGMQLLPNTSGVRSGMGPIRLSAVASSPLTGFLGKGEGAV